MSGKVFSKNLLSIWLVTIAIFITITILSVAVYRNHQFNQKNFKSWKQNIELVKLHGFITHLDEALTMSASMASLTGDMKWEERYRSFQPKLDSAVKRLVKIAPSSVSRFTANTYKSNHRLKEMETQAFDFVHQNRLNDAKDIMFSKKYENYKKMYADGIHQLNYQINGALKATQKSIEERTIFNIKGMIFIILILISGWIFVMRTTIKSRALLTRETFELIREFEELENRNLTLDKKIEDRTRDLKNEIQERKQVEEKLKEYSENLKKNNKELDQFAYIVSHDLRAPLRAISSLSGWIKEDLGSNLSEQNKKNMDLLESRVQRMDSLINGILEYSKIGRMKVSAETVNVNDLLDEIVDLLSPPSKFTVIVQSEMPTLVTEKILLQQVFSNLINNAIKYNDKPEGKIDISVAESENFYEFTVADNGPGIAPEHHDKIFGIFQTIAPKDKVDSTGIGLSIVQRIIEEHGGKVWIDSEKDSGAKFIFTWPKQPGIKANEEEMKSNG